MLRLTRAHRQLFLLIDGNRPVVLLARMVGRDLSEVHALLMDLVNVGIIRL
jgi:predicted transcriptional regulator